MKKTLLAIALAAATTTAYADTSVSGHVNYIIGDREDFNAGEDVQTQNAFTSQSRFRFKASTEAGGATYGLTIEQGVLDSGVNRRVDEFYVKGAFGKISLGQGSEAGDGKSESDFSGTYVGNGAAYNSWNINSQLRQVDGGRDERIRYDSPKLGPVTISADYDSVQDFSVAAGAGGAFWKAGVYFESRDDDDSDEVGGSLAFKFGGFTIALQGGTLDDTADGADDGHDFTKTIVGYNGGPISVAVDFATDESNSGLERETLGVTFVYRPTKGVELYAGLRSAESDAAEFNGEDDGDAFLAGGRVKF